MKYHRHYSSNSKLSYYSGDQGYDMIVTRSNMNEKKKEQKKGKSRYVHPV